MKSIGIGAFSLSKLLFYFFSIITDVPSEEAEFSSKSNMICDDVI
jgi:hypothetical protein